MAAVRPGRRGVRLLRRAAGGIDLELLEVDGIGRWRVLHPPGAHPEALAVALAQGMAVRKRFGAHLPDPITLSFDRSSQGLVSGRTAGEAHVGNALIRLRADDALEGRSGQRIARVVTHELAHLLDEQFQATRFRDSMELRRRLGEHLGVASLERLRPGTEPHARFMAEVTPYAGTNVTEAFAELFREHWFRPERLGVVALFGELLEEFFPQS